MAEPCGKPAKTGVRHFRVMSRCPVMYGIQNHNAGIDIDLFHPHGSVPSTSAIESFSSITRTKFDLYLHTRSKCAVTGTW